VDVRGHGPRRVAAPDLIDQALGRDRLVRVEQEQREDGALLRPAQRERAVVGARLEGAEQAVLQRPSFVRFATTVPVPRRQSMTS
jgi:hypothetical protein